MATFYDKTVDIWSVEIIRKKWADVKTKTVLYNDIVCDYYIATRWNVVNRQPDLWNREQDLDRIDLIIPASSYDETKVIKQGQYVTTKDWDSYIIDQLDYYYMPSGELESIYIRLNQKWN